jgi:hypothetical protein
MGSESTPPSNTLHGIWMSNGASMKPFCTGRSPASTSSNGTFVFVGSAVRKSGLWNVPLTLRQMTVPGTSQSSSVTDCTVNGTVAGAASTAASQAKA